MKKRLWGGLLALLLLFGSLSVLSGCGGSRYTIYYNLNGGTLNAESCTVKYGENYTLDVPTNAGATFLGWYRSLDADSEAVTDAYGASLEKYSQAQDSVVFAKWEYWDADGLVYEMLADGTGYGVSAAENFSSDVLKIPAEYNGKPVVRINSYGFSGQKKLKNVVMPDSIVSVGSFAFDECISLSSVAVSDNIEEIGRRAFYNCNQLISFDFPGALHAIGEEAFAKCGMLGTADLSGVSGDLTMEDRAFAGCAALSDLKLTGNLRVIPESAFSGCTALKELNVVNGIEKVENSAFQGCSQMRKIVLGDSVRMIGYYAFDGCALLSEIGVGENNAYFTAKDNVLFTKDGSKLLRYAPYQTGVSYVVPSTVTEIDNGAFNSSYYLETVVVGRNVDLINANAFSGMLELTSITLPFIGGSRDYNSYFSYIFGGQFASTATNLPYTLKNVVILDGIDQIGEHAFQFCNSLNVISIPASVRTINDYAFYGCANLRELTLPAGLETIGKDAFLSCTRLQKIEIDESNGKFKTENGVLFNEEMTELLLYPAGRADKTYSTPEKVERIESNAFYYASNLTEAVLNEGLKEIGSGAFSYCRGLTGMRMPDSLTEIGEMAFNNCTKLERVEISENLESLGRQAFYQCRNLKEVKLGCATPPALGDLAFRETHEELKLGVPNEEAKQNYLADEKWAEYADCIFVKTADDEKGGE